MKEFIWYERHEIKTIGLICVFMGSVYSSPDGVKQSLRSFKDFSVCSFGFRDRFIQLRANRDPLGQIFVGLRQLVRQISNLLLDQLLLPRLLLYLLADVFPLLPQVFNALDQFVVETLQSGALLRHFCNLTGRYLPVEINFTRFKMICTLFC